MNHKIIEQDIIKQGIIQQDISQYIIKQGIIQQDISQGIIKLNILMGILMDKHNYLHYAYESPCFPKSEEKNPQANINIKIPNINKYQTINLLKDPQSSVALEYDIHNPI